VLVTGAAKRLGRAIALELAAHGWNVAVHYRRSQAEAHDTVGALRVLGAAAEAFGADLADEAQCEALLPQVVQRMGPLSALVNNASLFAHDDIASLRYESLARHWRSNAASAIVLARALHAPRTHSTLLDGDACVVLLDEKLFNRSPVHAFKAALHAATPLLVRVGAGAGVCGVALGSRALEGPAIDHRRLAERSQGPPGHGVEVHDVAHAVRFVLENPSITGSTLLIDAGSHLMPRARDFAFTATDTTP
jgi:NAD(P)-dependent dehydrogenase (short-subunit alcohol dehydrogenase family)